MPHLRVPLNLALNIHFRSEPLLAELYDDAAGGIPAPISARVFAYLVQFASAIVRSHPGTEVAPFLADVLRAYDESLMAPPAADTDAGEDYDDDEEEVNDDENDDNDDDDAADADYTDVENDDLSLISEATTSSSATTSSTTASTTANARGRKRSPRSGSAILTVLENIRDEITELREELGARADAAAATTEPDTPAYSGYTPPWSVRAVQAHNQAQAQANGRNACEYTRCEGDAARRPTYWGFGPGGAGW